MTPRVVLVGLPGTGKTTTGRRLAKILATEFADSDDLVERTTGHTVRELFAGGESAFRTAEADVVAVAMRDFGGVLALGGGALTTRATRAVVTGSGAPVVLLQASIPTLTDRVGSAETRPLLTASPAQRLQQLSDERAKAYVEVATLVVETDGRTPGQVASHIAAELHRMGVGGV